MEPALSNYFQWIISITVLLKTLKVQSMNRHYPLYHTFFQLKQCILRDCNSSVSTFRNNVTYRKQKIR